MDFNNTIQYSNISHKLLCYWLCQWFQSSNRGSAWAGRCFYLLFLALLKHTMQSPRPVFSALHHFSLSQSLNDHSGVWEWWLTTAANLTLFDLVCDLLQTALALLLTPQQFGCQFVWCLSHTGFCFYVCYFIVKDHVLYCTYELLKCLISWVFYFILLTFVVWLVEY